MACSNGLLFACADKSLIVSMFRKKDPLSTYAQLSSLAAVVSGSMKQQDNSAAFLHATTQCASLKMAHGMFVTSLDGAEDILHLQGLIKVLTDPSQPRPTGGGYSQQGLDMLVHFCAKHMLPSFPRKLITNPATQISSRHATWCRELSPLLTRYSMLCVELPYVVTALHMLTGCLLWHQVVTAVP